MAKFEYFYMTQCQADLEIEDIGNCAIEANDDSGTFYYLIIRTKYGTTSIVEYGPIVLDMDIFPKQVVCTFKRIDFSEAKIEKTIDEFLNKGSKNITQARECGFNDAISNCRSIIDYIKDEDAY